MSSSTPSLLIQHEAHPAPTPLEHRKAHLENLQFGRIFTDYMVSIDYDKAQGWHSARLTPRIPLTLDPATAVLHYAQTIFEGMKAYRLADGTLALFRPDANARRFNNSARRMAMAELPEDIFIAAVKSLVRADSDWFPDIAGGSLYVRPFMYANEIFLGVKPSASYKFLVIASPVGGYFASGHEAISLWVSQDYTRAARGGTGAAKCGGNYAASLRAQQEASARGFDQTVFLDAIENRWVEELGGMNLFFIFDDGRIITPPLSGTILPGITRDSLITLAREDGLEVHETRYAIDQWQADATSGHLLETLACGTAAAVTAVGKVTRETEEFTIGSGGCGQITRRLRDRLLSIQRGTAPDPHGWVEPA